MVQSRGRKITLTALVLISIIVAGKSQSATQCFACQDRCHQVTVEDCLDVDSTCFTSKEVQDDASVVITKGCKNALEVEDFCAVVLLSHENSTCNYCPEDFCNSDYPVPPEEDPEIINTGVGKCFSCEDECTEVLEQDCTSSLAETAGNLFQAACFSFSAVNADGLRENQKSCVSKDATIVQTCSYANSLNTGVVCRLCDQDLCNNEPPIRTVDKCYFCDGTCEYPLQEQNCVDVLGINPVARCRSKRTTSNGREVIEKSCVSDTISVQLDCTTTNLRGGNCTICDSELCNWEETENVIDTGVKECFGCQGDCQVPTIENCQEKLGINVEAVCVSSKAHEGGVTVYTKGCFARANVGALCSNAEECQFCESHLCNVPVNNTGVETCHYCQGNCLETTEENCTEKFSHLGDFEAGCITQGPATDLTDVVRGCIVKTLDSESQCFLTNTQEDFSCSICSENLCNSLPEKKTGAEKCYLCEGQCQTPLQEHNCRELFGEDVVTGCIDAKFLTAQGTVVVKSCVEDNEEIRANCQILDSSDGECQICDSDLCNLGEIEEPEDPDDNPEDPEDPDDNPEDPEDPDGNPEKPGDNSSAGVQPLVVVILSALYLVVNYI